MNLIAFHNAVYEQFNTFIPDRSYNWKLWIGIQNVLNNQHFAVEYTSFKVSFRLRLFIALTLSSRGPHMCGLIQLSFDIGVRIFAASHVVTMATI